ncbi:hypothetical protein [Solimonas flava]|uniref:hypothetical protein n=1 Tax=Solimonas flava TaxID=415849 RepID=UPI00040DF69E|nr:hypothetical protein [Solimonas flava]
MMKTTSRRGAIGLLLLSLACSGCGRSEVAGGSPAPAIPPEQDSIDGELGLAALDAGRCDPTDPHYCLYPWPNDYYTVADDRTDTGRRVALTTLSMPKNVLGKPIDPAEWNRNDGFSPGQLILARVPGLDLARTGAVPITDLADARRAEQPVVVIDADTLERQPVWSELDANLTKFTACDSGKPLAALAELVGIEPLAGLAQTLGEICAALPLPDTGLGDPGPALMIRPAVNFREGRRYIVALRRLKDADGATIEASPAFRIYRDNHRSDNATINARRPHMEALFATLARAGIARDSLYLAWDFTIASRRNLSERALHMRDEALANLGGAAPGFTVDSVTEHSADEDPDIAREISGTLTVPSYLSLPNGAPGSRLRYGDDGLPEQNSSAPTMRVPYTCMLPRAAFGDADSAASATRAVPARISLYGHGLLGSHDEVGAGNVRDMAQEHDMAFCAVDWIGMSSGDIVNVATILLDMSNFPTLADRAQQGFLNFMFLGRAMLGADGFCADPAFRVGQTCVLDRAELFYDGNSQGGIMGGALVALSPDIRAGVLGVPGMNYSTLLRRSVDFDTYAAFLYAAYQHSLDQATVLSLIQMLWDRAEANGYAQHLRADDPLPGAPAKRVLLHVAFGDHQVSMWTAEVEARTIGARIHCPAVVGGPDPQSGDKVQAGANPAVTAEMAAAPTLSFGRRHPDDAPYYGLDCLGAGRNGGSAIIVWDSGPTVHADGSPAENGVAPPPIDNRPPRPDLGYGADPHSFPRSTVAARLQKSEFLKSDGAVVDTCAGRPCATRDFDTSPP